MDVDDAMVRRCREMETSEGCHSPLASVMVVSVNDVDSSIGCSLMTAHTEALN